MKKKSLAIFLAVIIAATLLPATTQAADSDFMINENGVLTKYNGLGGDVVIPEGVTSIGSRAFEDCSALTSVDIPEGVTQISSYAFRRCTNLVRVKIPVSLTSIEGLAFQGTPWWESLEGEYVTINDILFDYRGKGGEVTIPEGVTAIGEDAFRGCTTLTTVTLPKGLTSIGRYAFYNCANLTDVVIPDSVTIIGGSAFSDCVSLTGVTIPDSVTDIGGYAFYQCTGLTGVTIPDSVTHIGGRAFQGTPWWEDLKGEFVTVNGILLDYRGKGGEVVLPENVTDIAEFAFYGCTGLTGVTIPKGLTSIENFTFYGCTGLTGMTIPEGVTSIGFRSFKGCANLTNVTIPESVTNIEPCAFEDCPSLTSVTIPESVTSIGERAFSDCTSLTRVVVPESVARIGQEAFRDCIGLVGMAIPASVTDIADDAFVGCGNLTVYGVAGSTAAEYCVANNIPFAEGIMPSTAQAGTLTGDVKSLRWAITEEGMLTVTEQIVDGEMALVACYDNQGRFTGVKWLDADHASAQIDPSTPNVKLFWLDATQKPQSPSATVWGK